MFPTFYCNCFPHHEPHHIQHKQRNLMCGSAGVIDPNYISYITSHGCLLDNTGDNISHLNRWFGDLTGLYWVWKNTNDEFVGTSQYRRFWYEEEVRNAIYNENTLYISQPITFPRSIYDQFIEHHGELPLKLFKDIISSGVIDMTVDKFDLLKSITSISSCNMFYSHRTLFNKICAIIFDIAFEIYNGTRYALPYIQQPNQYRMIAYIIERVLNVIYANSKYYLGDAIKIQPIGFYVT